MPRPTLRFSRYRDIADEIAERLATARGHSDPLRAWDEEVIVPSSGVRHAISAELLRQMPRGVAGLRMQSIEELALRLVNAAGEFPRIASDAERRLAMRTAIRAIDHPMMEGRGVAAMLERSYRDVRDHGVTLADLAARVRNARGLRNAERTKTILRAWTEYERLIAQLGAVDGADVLARAAMFASRAKTQLVAGFYDMTGAQRKLIESLIGEGKIETVWMPSDSAFAQPLMTALGLSTDRGMEPRELPPSALRALPSVHDELRHVCGEVAALLAEGSASIGIVARSLDPYDASLLARFAAEQGFSITLDAAIPLAAHRLGRGAITLLRLRERGFPRAEVLELVRDGLRMRTQISVDAVDAATRRARLAGGTSAELQPFRNRGAELEQYLALVAELEEITIDLDLLGRLGSMFRIDSELDVQAAEELERIAMLFRRTSVWNRGLDVASVIDAIEQVELKEPPHSKGVWAGEMLRFRGHTFDHLFVVRMQDDVFPQRRNEDPLLPDSDRRILRLREIGDGADEEQLLLQLLFDGATSAVHFSYASGDGFGKVLRPSRFVRGMECGSSAAAFETAGKAAALRKLQLLVKAGTKSTFDGYLTIDVANRLASVSPTQLEDFGECPHKFLLKHLLGVEDLEHPERELQIDVREKGTLDHAVLERFYRGIDEADIARSAKSLPSELAQRLDALIDEAFDAHEQKFPAYNKTVRAMERRATKRILREFLAADLADLNEHELVPRHFEYRFGRKHRELADHPEPFVVDAAGVPIRIEGTIDRIDVGTTKHRIVDYKSGKALRHSGLAEKIDRGVRLQLALYAMAVSEFFHVDPNDVSGTIKPLVVDGFRPQKFEFQLGEKREALLETLHIFMTAILKGVFPAFPNEGDFDSCKYCPVNHSCRTRHDPEETYALQREKDPRTLLSS